MKKDRREQIRMLRNIGEYTFPKPSVSPRTRSNTAALNISRASRHSAISEEPRSTVAFDTEIVLKTGKSIS